ncbi:hypothetical protein BD410DRAFT_449017 [Rickenella mellea]|uniref:Uncharacterized protein n=1 Tax=Rickenella mellea TaxID=50990 RepID=A0A4Y7PUF6_9AGAM|nr:hypothetical protein BD410DRAFT_449017 [Rickenella mellea]
MFKRKKSSINVTQQQPAPSPQQPTVTPLYERFATKAANAPTSFPSAFSASTNSVNYNGSGDGVSISRPMTLGKPAPGAPVVQGRTRLASLQAQKSTQELYQDTSARVLSPSSRREKALPPSQPRQQQGYGQTTSRTTFTQNGQSVPFHALDQLQPSSTSSNPYATYDREQPSPPPPPHSRETSSSSASAGASSVLPRKSSPELLRSRLASTSRVPDKRGSAYFRDDDPNPVHAQTDAVHAPTPAVPIPRPNPNPNAIPRKRYSLYDAPTPSSTTPIPSSTPTPTPHAQGQGQGQVRAPAMSFSTSSTSSLSRASVEKPLPPLIPDDDDGRAGNNNVPLGPPHAAYATPEPTRSPSPSSFNHNKHNNGDTNQNQNQNQNQSATDLDTNPAYNTKVKSKEKEKRDKRAYVNGRSEDAYHEPHSPLSPPTSPERHRQRPSPSPLRHQNAETESDIYTRSRTADDDVEVFKPPKMSLETHRRSPSPTVTGIGMARPQTPPTPTSPRVLRERAGAHARPVVSSLSTAPTTTFASASPPSSDPSVTSPTGSTPTPTSANANAGGSGSGSGPSSPERQQQQRPTLLSLASSQSSPTQRKKYSPLAAFRATSSASVPTTSSTTSTTTEGPNVNANVRVDTSPEGSTAQIGSTYPSKSTSPINNPNNAKRDGSGSAVSVSYDQIMSKSTTGTRSRREGSGGGSVDEKTGVSKVC